MITEERLNEIEAATARQWKWVIIPQRKNAISTHVGTVNDFQTTADFYLAGDAEKAIAALDAVPTLVAEVRDLRHQLEAAQAALDEIDTKAAACGHLERWWKTEPNGDAWCVMCALERSQVQLAEMMKIASDRESQIAKFQALAAKYLSALEFAETDLSLRVDYGDYRYDPGLRTLLRRIREALGKEVGNHE